MYCAVADLPPLKSKSVRAHRCAPHPTTPRHPDAQVSATSAGTHDDKRKHKVENRLRPWTERASIHTHTHTEGHALREDVHRRVRFLFYVHVCVCECMYMSVCDRGVPAWPRRRRRGWPSPSASAAFLQSAHSTHQCAPWPVHTHVSICALVQGENEKRGMGSETEVQHVWCTSRVKGLHVCTYTQQPCVCVRTCV
jgi:hypothetical protein